MTPFADENSIHEQVSAADARLQEVALKVLITGATGFIGARLAETLIKTGHDVRGLAQQTSDTSLLKKLDVEIVRGNIRDAVAMKNAVKDCQCVYHLAAKKTKDRLSKKQYYVHNVEGTKNVAQAALSAGVSRLVYASTIGVYGTLRNSSIDENTAPKPDSFYRETKLGGEKEIVRLHRENGLPAVVARLGTIFGPGSCSWLDLCHKIVNGNLRIIGTGENYDQMVYVDDLVEGLRRCGETRCIEGRKYILAGAEPAKLRRVLEILAEELGADRFLETLSAGPFRVYQRTCAFAYRSFGVELPRSHYYDLFLTNCIFTTTKAQEELGYFPKVSLRDGFRRLLTWYREKGHLPPVEQVQAYGRGDSTQQRDER
jgi:nucleoside-diphosphate-sugar epimerase